MNLAKFAKNAKNTLGISGKQMLKIDEYTKKHPIRTEEMFCDYDKYFNDFYEQGKQEERIFRRFLKCKMGCLVNSLKGRII